ncbi:MAG TPA: nucleotidyltransferase family protein [Longimicrobiaceae bacterium]|nr:nucleotidyltransferase family protein [Longimicrobiaceae bacterium]
MLRPGEDAGAATASPEQRIVVQCARALVGAGPDPSVAAVLDADPDRLVPLAWAHGMLPYLSRRVVAAPEASAHPSLAPLRAAFVENGIRALNLTGELASVSALLAAAGVTALAYKGPALAIQAYGEAALRDCGDLDLVVRKEQLAAAGAALVASGFQDVSVSRAEHREALLRRGHHLAFRRHGLLVELHWRFGKSVFGFTEEVSGLWGRAEEVEVRGGRVQVLSAPDHLLALAIHSSKAMWSSLDGTVCMVRLARRVAPGAWPEVVERARSWRCEEALRVSLVLGEQMLGAAYPRELAEHLPPTPAARRLAARVEAELFLDEFGGPSYLLGQLALRPRYRDRLRFALGALLHAGASADDDAPPRPGTGALARFLRVVRKYWR